MAANSDNLLELRSRILARNNRRQINDLNSEVGKLGSVADVQQSDSTVISKLETIANTVIVDERIVENMLIQINALNEKVNNLQLHVSQLQDHTQLPARTVRINMNLNAACVRSFIFPRTWTWERSTDFAIQSANFRGDTIPRWVWRRSNQRKDRIDVTDADAPVDSTYPLIPPFMIPWLYGFKNDGLNYYEQSIDVQDLISEDYQYQVPGGDALTSLIGHSVITPNHYASFGMRHSNIYNGGNIVRGITQTQYCIPSTFNLRIVYGTYGVDYLPNGSLTPFTTIIDDVAEEVVKCAVEEFLYTPGIVTANESAIILDQANFSWDDYGKDYVRDLNLLADVVIASSLMLEVGSGALAAIAGIGAEAAMAAGYLSSANAKTGVNLAGKLGGLLGKEAQSQLIAEISTASSMGGTSTELKKYSDIGKRSDPTSDKGYYFFNHTTVNTSDTSLRCDQIPNGGSVNGPVDSSELSLSTRIVPSAIFTLPGGARDRYALNFDIINTVGTYNTSLFPNGDPIEAPVGMDIPLSQITSPTGIGVWYQDSSSNYIPLLIYESATWKTASWNGSAWITN